MKRYLILAAAPLIAGAVQPPPSLTVELDEVRGGKGVVHACLTRDPRHFPNCAEDPAALKQTQPASTARLRFSGFAPGRYALTLFHDENANQKLDTMFGIPREGFGFSRNPVVRFGAPKFRQVDIELGPGLSRQTVRMQYIL